MSLKQLFRQPMLRAMLGRQHIQALRSMTTQSDKVLVDLDPKTGVAVVQMNRPPVNSLNLEFLSDINNTLDKLHNDKSCRGLILTSSNNKVFCAGLDIMEMYQPQTDRLTEFWKTLQNVWMNLYGSRLATIAAINGHSPAGGCLLATCCDYRIMVQNFTIGLNETQLGIIPPFWFVDSMEGVVGYRQTELACQKGLMMTTDQASKIGLVDEVVTPEVVLQKAQNEMVSWLKIPDYARQLTKSQMKMPNINKLRARRDEDVQHFVNFITKDSVQQALGFYIENLKKKAKK
ncbi:dodecenoyl-CoA isomerase [Mactra antiquata]